jgi:protein-S-isoprenylcysteine O-methyltransferase Ste14
MASQLATPRTIPAAPRTPAERFTRLCVRRRVPITVGLLVALLLLDGFVFNGDPRNVTDWTNPFVVVGELLILCGLLVRAWAAGTLKKQKQLATTGPYAVVRHPLYFGSILMMLGFSALGFAPLSLLVIAPPLAWIYWLAMKSEERHVASLFPLEWPSYASRVPGFIPRRLVLPRLADWSLAQWLKNSEYQAWLGAAVGLTAIKLYHLWLFRS